MLCKNCITLKVLLEHNYTIFFDFDKSFTLYCKVCKAEIFLYSNAEEEQIGDLEVDIK